MSEVTLDVGLPFNEHQSTNENATATIILIHGAFSSRDEWSPMIPDLSKKFHVLAPDLPEHGEAAQSLAFSKDLSVALLAKLIQQKGIQGKAHVIGFSLGAHIAITLAERHPGLVRDVFVSGFGVFDTVPFFPYLFYASQRLESVAPRLLVRWLMDGTELTPDPRPVTLSRCRHIAPGKPPSGSAWPAAWPARTLVVAAGKSGLLPTADSSRDAVKLRDIGRRRNSETIAYTHPQMRHPWNRQDPALCAQTALAWFSKEPLPDSFVLL